MKTINLYSLPKVNTKKNTKLVNRFYHLVYKKAVDIMPNEIPVIYNGKTMCGNLIEKCDCKPDSCTTEICTS